MTTTSLVDWSTLEARYPQAGFLQRLANTTLATHAETPARLRDMARSGDMAALAFLAHTVKGLGASLLARRVQDAAKDADAALRTHSTNVPDLIEHLADEMEALLAEVAHRYR